MDKEGVPMTGSAISIPKKFQHVCPRNCYSACTMISTVKNERLIHVCGDKKHPFSRGKLCAQGFAYIQANYHQDRIKYPYFQEVKGTGNFRKITWEEAYGILIDKMKEVYNRKKDFSSFGFYQSKGNIGAHRFFTKQFLTTLGTTRILAEENSAIGFEAVQYDNEGLDVYTNPNKIRMASMIIIWGANPAETNVHLIPFLMEAKERGTKVVVIDPLYTQTAQLADLYVQIRPSTDGALVHLLIKLLMEFDHIDYASLEKHTINHKPYLESIKLTNTQHFLNICDISMEALSYLRDYLFSATSILHIVGVGLQQHVNGGQNVRAIQALAAVRGDLWKHGGGIYFPQRPPEKLFQQCTSGQKDLSNKTLQWNDWVGAEQSTENGSTIDLLWISGANPLTQRPNTNATLEKLHNTNFIVSLEQFLTPTISMSNLILPTTSHFEHFDLICSHWGIALNEKAITPFYESRSEWYIVAELAKRVQELWPHLITTPNYTSELDYLNHYVHITGMDKVYGIDRVTDLKQCGWKQMSLPDEHQDEQKVAKYHFSSTKAQQYGHPSKPVFVAGLLPSKTYPFWLISPHHSYRFNSQFWLLNLDKQQTPFIYMNQNTAEKRGIENGTIVHVYNNYGFLHVQAVLSKHMPEDVILIYQGWVLDGTQNVNKLVPAMETDMGEKLTDVRGIAYYDSFVNIKRL